MELMWDALHQEFSNFKTNASSTCFETEAATPNLLDMEGGGRSNKHPSDPLKRRSGASPLVISDFSHSNETQMLPIKRMAGLQAIC